MTLIKSLLLGSAAGIVAIAGAQAADLPTKKGAPAAQYVTICNIGGVTGFTIPGSDTCLKISGYVSAQYTYGAARTTTQNAIGMFARGQVSFDAVSNTAYGPLLAHIDVQEDYGTGFDSRYGGYGAGNARTQLNNGYITWAGLTAGKHGSFFDYLAGGQAWDDFISPDHTGGPVPLIAYTASFGGGFSASLSLETPEGAPAGGSEGTRAPDVVGQLAVKQGWGGAQLSAVAHNSIAAGGAQNEWGFGVLGGLTFNIPGMAGADVKLQGVYAYDAAGYSGMGSWGDYNFAGAAGEGGSPLARPDYYVIGNTIDHSTAWSVAGIVDLPVSASFKISPEASYGSISYSNSYASESAFVGGAVLEWTPVKNLVFDLDLLYVNGSYTGTLGNTTKTSFDGFTGKLRIERDF